MKRSRLFVLAVLLFFSVLPLQSAAADIGPKPTMDFEFVQLAAGPSLTIVSGTLSECNQPDCSDARPLSQVGPQRFSCDATSCSATAYGFSPYHRIEIQFSDGRARTSNVFETAAFDAEYKVTIGETGLLVEPRASPWRLTPVLVTLSCLCLVGLIITVIALVVRYLIRKK
jgi:hypothetical protein